MNAFCAWEVPNFLLCCGEKVKEGTEWESNLDKNQTFSQCLINI